MAQHPRLHAIPGGRDDRPRSDSAGQESDSVPSRLEPSPPQSDSAQQDRGRLRSDATRHGPARLRSEPAPAEPLWREALGRRLRALRAAQRETLAETAGRAGVSPQYLSEIERGRKDPSSEMIAALAGALGTTLIGLTEHVIRDLQQGLTARRSARPTLMALAA